MPAGAGSDRIGQFGVDVEVDGARDVPGLVLGPSGSGLVEIPAHVDDADVIEVGGEPLAADEIVHLP